VYFHDSAYVCDIEGKNWTKAQNRTIQTDPRGCSKADKTSITGGVHSKVPIEQFDFIVTEECHRSIYNLWEASPGYLMLFDRLNSHA
jgi:type I site-specific restriction endonuclease